MRQFSMFLLIVTLISSSSNFYAQTFTMGKKCLAALAEAESTLAENMPEKALTLFDEFSSKCKTNEHLLKSRRPIIEITESEFAERGFY